jgi:hypothetical protein
MALRSIDIKVCVLNMSSWPKGGRLLMDAYLVFDN